MWSHKFPSRTQQKNAFPQIHIIAVVYYLLTDSHDFLPSNNPNRTSHQAGQNYIEDKVLRDEDPR